MCSERRVAAGVRFDLLQIQWIQIETQFKGKESIKPSMDTFPNQHLSYKYYIYMSIHVLPLPAENHGLIPRLQTIPVCAEGHGLMKPTEPHHLQRAEMKF